MDIKEPSSISNYDDICSICDYKRDVDYIETYIDTIVKYHDENKCCKIENYKIKGSKYCEFNGYYETDCDSNDNFSLTNYDCLGNFLSYNVTSYCKHEWHYYLGYYYDHNSCLCLASLHFLSHLYGDMKMYDLGKKCFQKCLDRQNMNLNCNLFDIVVEYGEEMNFIEDERLFYNECIVFTILSNQSINVYNCFESKLTVNRVKNGIYVTNKYSDSIVKLFDNCIFKICSESNSYKSCNKICFDGNSYKKFYDVDGYDKICFDDNRYTIIAEIRFEDCIEDCDFYEIFITFGLDVFSIFAILLKLINNYDNSSNRCYYYRFEILKKCFEYYEKAVFAILSVLTIHNDFEQSYCNNDVELVFSNEYLVSNILVYFK